MKTIKDVYYSGIEDTARSLDVYLPDAECKAVFLYMHGGGLEKGDKSRSGDAVVEYLTARRWLREHKLQNVPRGKIS